MYIFRQRIFVALVETQECLKKYAMIKQLLLYVCITCRKLCPMNGCYMSHLKQ